MAITSVNGAELYHEIKGDGAWVVLTHGSWTDGTGWAPAVAAMSDRYRVVTWDRRGHSRSGSGDGPGSRAEDAADLVGLIESLDAAPVHLVGNSYGAIVTLTALTARPDLVATAAVHEPPLWGLLEGTADPAVSAALAAADAELAVVADMIRAGDHRGAGQHFIDHVALGPGSWDQLPAPLRAVVEANAPTFLDELADETALSIDGAALAATDVPLLLTRGTASPSLFTAVISELARLVPAARVEILAGAGHVPHSTHTADWVSCLSSFHERQPAQNA